MQFTKKLAVTVLLGVLAALMLVAIASAHYTNVYQGSDKGSVDLSHDHLRISDRECDGNYVYAEGWDNGQYGYHKVYDRNGCSSGDYHADGVNFTRYRVCEDLGTSIVCSVMRYT